MWPQAVIQKLDSLRQPAFDVSTVHRDRHK